MQFRTSDMQEENIWELSELWKEHAKKEHAVEAADQMFANGAETKQEVLLEECSFFIWPPPVIWSSAVLENSVSPTGLTKR